MECDVLARVQRIDDLICQVGHRLARIRNTAIGDRKGSKFEPAGSGRGRFANKSELRFFSRLQERDDDVDTSLMPGSRLTVKPLGAARLRDNAKSSSPRSSDPENLCSHLP